MDGSSLGSWEETASDESSDRDDEFLTAEVGDSRENLETVGVLKINFGNNSMEPRKDSLTDSSSLKLERVHVLEKKLVAKGKRREGSREKVTCEIKRRKGSREKASRKRKESEDSEVRHSRICKEVIS